MALIIPKNNADEQTLDATLKIYYDADDWVENSYLIDKLSSALDALGIEDIKKEPQSYTKKTQVLAYYGFIIWEDVTNAQSRRKITELGKRFYDARRDGIQSAILDILIESLNECTFGRNVIGCNSDSDLEPPNIFLKSALLLEGINLNEFAYILQRMEFDKVELADAIFDVTLKRKMGQSVNPNAIAAKWTDPKPILALGNWGLFHVEKVDRTNHYYLNKDVVSAYSKELMALRTKNTETLRFTLKGNDDMNDEEIKNHQIIYYGAPGTGKSNTIKRDTEAAEKDDRAFRTTFHPDSDYSTFVGCYKPTMKPTGVILASNEKEEVITYKFTPQAFTNAYVKAWNTKEDVYLIIEEINRGNCAQIFGDLFQLLDRKDGYSEYPVDADSDLSNYLQEKLSASTRSDFPKGVKEGVKLVLPNNLYIWATMNTSDQSLFPIDSAFKRRWEWVYIPIKNHEDINYTIEIGDSKYNWWGFLERINEVINSTTSSEDKKLGYFFAKADDTIIKAEQFVGKVLFYLWNDVFKNYGFDNPIFEKEDKKKFAFSDFFLADGKPNVENINKFMERLNEKVEKDTLMIIKKQEAPAETEA